MTPFTPVSAAIGGALIGAAAVLLFRLNGRIAGVSGIVHGLLGADSGDRLWRGLFVAGLIIGGWLYPVMSGEPLTATAGLPIWLLVLAGLIVGAGTRLGSGCTSGHGVCGIARLSMRSVVATVVFLVCGMATATLVHGVLS